jgi:raffinose/stachyose/melibiose transport system permease protein
MIFLGPMLLAFIAVKFIPLLLSGWYSLTDWNGISSRIAYAGIRNYLSLASDSRYWASLWFTLKFAFFALALSNFLGFVLAYLLVKPMKMKELLRAAFYIPNTIGGLVLGFIWKFIFLSFFGYLFSLTGWKFFGLSWLSTPATSFWAMVIVQVWVLMGYLMLLYIAGLTQIPMDTMEAAVIDGANGFKALIYVKIPLIMPTITRCIFISFLMCMRVYDLNISLTAGNPFRSSESVTMNIYSTAFTESHMGYGCAKALVFIVIVMIISCLQVYFTSKNEVDA